MAVAVWTSFQQISDSTGAPYSGAKVNVYAAGTTTPLSLFSDEGLSVGVSNPIVCDSSGQHAMTYIATASYKTSVTDTSGTPLTNWSKDHIDPGVAVGSGALQVANGGTGATTAGAARTNLGVPATATVTAIASDVTTLQGYHTGTSALKVASGSTAQRSVSPADYDVRGNTTLVSPEMYLGGTWYKISLAPPAAGGFKNLSITNNASTPNTKVDLTADTVIVQSSGNVGVHLDSVSLTIDCGTIGANGIDAGSLANSTFYSVWVIFNPTTGTTAGLVSSSGTSPTMPSGYTFKARLGWFLTDGSAHFFRQIQYGREVQYIVGTNPANLGAAPHLVASGAVGTYSTTSPVLASTSLSGIVPTTASRAKILCTTTWKGAAAGAMVVAPNTSWGGTNNGAAGSNGNTYPFYNPGTAVNAMIDLILESNSIGIASNNSACAVQVLGYTDNI